MLDSACGRQFRSVFVALLLLGTATPAVPPARAQSGNASLSLSALDPQGLAVAAAAVTVESSSTGFRRHQIAGEDGVCLFSLLPPGEYSVTVEAQGFSPARLEGVRLNVNQQGRQYVSMSLANEAATVTVEAPPPLLESATVTQVVDRQFVGNLPLNGRSFQSLIALGPGIVNVAASSNSPGQFSVNGQRPNSNYFMVDGVSATFGTGASFIPSAGEDGSAAALTAFGGTNSLVSVDAMQEFEVQTSTFAPEYGRMPGAQVSIVTRAGTNDFHGTLFHYFRNEVLDANDWFANRDSLPKPQMRQNNFGGVLGGPIVSNRTFFFSSYEGLRLRQPQFSTAAYPDLEVRANAAPELLSAVRAFPVPQLESLDDGLARFAATYSNPSSLNATSFRIDHRFSDSVSLFGRYNYAPSSIEVRGGPGFRDLSLNTISTTQSGNQTLTVGPSWVIAPNLLNDLRFNWSRSTALLDSVIDGFGGAEVPPESALFPPFSSPKTGVVGLYLLNTAGYALGVSADNAQNQINIVDTLAYIVGRHELKFGF
ncbi:MAG: TonB-dependent receptor, partial [Bryobacterales bacterium]|nr:TonB-dependent receptor [Bryobacterales bacterium]